MNSGPKRKNFYEQRAEIKKLKVIQSNAASETNCSLLTEISEEPTCDQTPIISSPIQESDVDAIHTGQDLVEQHELSNDGFSSDASLGLDISIENTSENSQSSESIHFPLQWAFLRNNISHKAVNDILTVLNKYHPEDKLPKDARTFLCTPSAVTIESLEDGGSYIHLGIHNSLLHRADHLPEHITLDLNIDGLPLYHSSKVQLWPILCSIVGSNLEPFAVSLYIGTKKPDLKYFEHFTSEYLHLSSEEFFVKAQRHTLSIRCLVCDAPARAFVKQCKGHTAYSGCERCLEKGIREDHRLIYRTVDSVKRTDESFSCQEDPNHHNGESPFNNLGIELVSHVPLDYMHLCLL